MTTTMKMKRCGCTFLRLILIRERSECKVRYPLYLDHRFPFLSDYSSLVNITSFSLADLRYLELVRRGEQADRISTLSRTKGTAEQSIENERCAEWDRAFAAMQEKAQPQILQPFSAAVSHVQSTTYSHSSTSTLQGSRSSQPHRSLLKISTWLKRGKPSTG